MHPTARIVLYLLSALAVPGLSFFGLSVLLGMSLLGLWFHVPALYRLLWRTRWLFLLIFLGDAFSYPGDAVLAGLGSYAPTWQGFGLGLDHIFHLFVILFMLAVLVFAMDRESQLAGLYGLMRLFSRFGLDPEVATVRLGLTLDLMEQPVSKKTRLRDLLSNIEPDNPAHDTYVLTMPSWHNRDTAYLLVASILLVVLWQLG